MPKVLVRLARVKKLSVPVPVPRRSAPAVMPEAEVEHKVLSPIPKVAHQLEVSPLVADTAGASGVYGLVSKRVRDAFDRTMRLLDRFHLFLRPYRVLKRIFPGLDAFDVCLCQPTRLGVVGRLEVDHLRQESVNINEMTVSVSSTFAGAKPA